MRKPFICQACGTFDEYHLGGGPLCIELCKKNRLALRESKERVAELRFKNSGLINTELSLSTEIEQLTQQLAAANAALAKIQWSAKHYEAQWHAALNLFGITEKELNAANAALAIARDELEIAKRCINREDYPNVQFDPSAALAERDRSIERRTAERCAKIAFQDAYGVVRLFIRRQFNLKE